MVSFVLGHLLRLVQGNYKLEVACVIVTKISFTTKIIIIIYKSLLVFSLVCNLGMVISLPIYIGMNIS